MNECIISLPHYVPRPFLATGSFLARFTKVEFREYSCARPTKRVISDVNWWVSGFAHIRRDVKVVFFFFIL